MKEQGQAHGPGASSGDSVIGGYCSIQRCSQLAGHTGRCDTRMNKRIEKLAAPTEDEVKIADLERQLAEAKGKLDAEIRVIIVVSKDAPSEYYRGRLSGLIFVRDHILKGEK